MTKKSIGIMGGTFDPIHYGHLISAEYVCDALNLDKIIFIPMGVHPHKDNNKITNKEQRINITTLAIKDNPRFEFSTIEVDRKGRTYTVDTIEYLISQYQNTSFYFIMGADSILDILNWKKPEKLMQLCRLAVVNRARYSNNTLIEQVKMLTTNYNARIDIIKIPDISISSTDIRNRVFRGQSIKYLLPESVELYILNNHLYKQIMN